MPQPFGSDLVQAMPGSEKPMPESAKPPKFLVQTITDWIDGGKLSINRLQRHVSYLQKSVAWMHTEPAQVRTCDNMSVLSCIPKPVNHLRTVNL